MQEKIPAHISARTDTMIAQLGRLVAYDSVQAPAAPGAPFGKPVAACLDEALAIAADMGFAVRNLDHYCGYAEMGEGADIIGIAAHLDIVPAGEGWASDPFTLTRKGDVLYGRGVSDDKGAIIAALHAMDDLRQSGVPLNKRVRLLMGCNEETGSACMAHYNAVEEPITVGFTPDGNFPGIHGEKGHCAMLATADDTAILSMQGGVVSNAVCSRCRTVVPAAAVDADALRAALSATPLPQATVTAVDDTLVIEAVGVAAHASTPQLGVNAAGYTMLALQQAGMRDAFVDFYLEKIGVQGTGEGLGLGLEDAYGALTLCNGLVRTEEGRITCTIDIRYPVTYNSDAIRSLCAPHLQGSGGHIEVGTVGEPLFYPADSALVRALHEAYVQVTGDTVSRPEVIGGGTYAKSLPGIIAFGCEFPGCDNHIHDVDERLPVEELQLQVAIYRRAIENLLQT